MPAHTDEEVQELFRPGPDAPEAPAPISKEAEVRWLWVIAGSLSGVILVVFYGSGLLRM